jgi:hypothetical protein
MRVPTLLRTTLCRTIADWFPLEPSGESNQSDTSTHTPLGVRRQWHGFMPVDGTSYPPRQLRVEMRRSRV